MTSYKKVLDYLYSQLPMYQRSGPAAYKNTLGNTLILDKMFNHPHQNFKSIHVAGTNGKGSSSHMIASVLQEAGYKTGLYTSPHLLDFRERIRVNGEMIPEDEVVLFVKRFKKMNETHQLDPSFFELTVAMAFDFFRNEKVDVAVVEVGLGGRLDSTNIITPMVSLITNISFDHTALLGHSIQKIAVEKAGIIKKRVPVVISESSSETKPVFVHKAQEEKSVIYFADDEFESSYSMLLPEGKQLFNFKKNGDMAFSNLKLDLLGNYQSKNISGVLKVFEILRSMDLQVDQQSTYRGLESISVNTGIRGRWEITGHNPLVVCDTAHNEAGITAVTKQIRSTAWKNLHIILGMVNDKEIDQLLNLLPKDGRYYFTQAQIPRALPADELAAKAEKIQLNGAIFPTVKQAFAEAKKNAGPNDLIFIGGSTFVVADYFS